MSVVLGLEDGSDGDVETDCDRTAGREKTDRTSSVQCEPVAQSVPVRQQGDATRVGQPNPAEVAEDELVSKARFLLFETAGGSCSGSKRAPSESERPQRSGACEVQRFSRLRWMQRSAGWR